MSPLKISFRLFTKFESHPESCPSSSEHTAGSVTIIWIATLPASGNSFATAGSTGDISTKPVIGSACVARMTGL